MTPTQIMMPVAIAAGALVFGLIFERVLVAWLGRLAARTRWEGDEILVRSLQAVLTYLFFVAGLYAATFSLRLSPELTMVSRNILAVVAIFLVTVIFSRMAVGFVNMYSRDALPSSTSIFAHLTQLLIFVLGVLVILQFLGISITPMLTALGVGGLGVALALQDTLSNLFSGLHIIASKQVRKGDYIKLDTGEEGYVEDITWRNTTIKALPNNMVVVPNAKLAAAILTNYNQPEQEMAVLVQVGIGYASDLEKAEKVTVEVAREVMREVEGGVADFEPFVRYHTFGDSNIAFTVIMRARQFVDQYLIKHQFIKRLHRRYDREGIEIPFPIRTVHIKQQT